MFSFIVAADVLVMRACFDNRLLNLEEYSVWVVTALKDSRRE